MDNQRHGVGYLTAVIPDAKGKTKVYNMIPVDMPPGQRCWRMKRRAGQNAWKTYTLTRNANGHYECTCPDFTYGEGRGLCKHLRWAISATLMVPLSKEGIEEIRRIRDQARKDGHGSNGEASSGASEPREAGARTPTEAEIPD